VNTSAGRLGKPFKPNELPQNKSFETEINKVLEEQLQIIQPIKFFTPKDIQHIIYNLNPKKASGYDLTVGRTLKELPKKRHCLPNIHI
jgi:hypothetical protein